MKSNCKRPTLAIQGSMAAHAEGRAISEAFTLVELLVVIAIIAVLAAILIPVVDRVREMGQRAVCLSNLRQLSFAWIQYADDNSGKLVGGTMYSSRTASEPPWVSGAFSSSETRSEVLADPNKGALWPYLQNVDLYRCPRARNGLFVTYGAVGAANGTALDGTIMDSRSYLGERVQRHYNRVGRTVLRLTRMSDIISPGPSQRAVFVDTGQFTSGFFVPYDKPEWGGKLRHPAPAHHGKGTTLSFADAHAEHWKWSRETVKFPLDVYMLPSPGPHAGLGYERLAEPAVPETPEGIRDLQRMQRAVWGRLGYTPEGDLGTETVAPEGDSTQRR